MASYRFSVDGMYLVLTPSNPTKTLCTVAQLLDWAGRRQDSHILVRLVGDFGPDKVYRNDDVLNLAEIDGWEFETIKRGGFGPGRKPVRPRRLRRR